jgi:hypothetical protein
MCLPPADGAGAPPVGSCSEPRSIVDAPHPGASRAPARHLCGVFPPTIIFADVSMQIRTADGYDHRSRRPLLQQQQPRPGQLATVVGHRVLGLCGSRRHLGVGCAAEGRLWGRRLAVLHPDHGRRAPAVGHRNRQGQRHHCELIRRRPATAMTSSGASSG